MSPDRGEPAAHGGERVIDLTMPIAEGIAAYPSHGRSALVLSPVMRHSDFAGRGRFNSYDGSEVSFEVSQWVLGDQVGTHMDAPFHVDAGSSASIDRVPLERAMGTAVLLHVPTARERRGISDRDLDRALAESGEELRQGDILLVRTGCSDSARDDPRAYATTAAGLDRSAAEWVRGHGVTAFGIDCVTIEAASSAGTADAHTNFLRPTALGLSPDAVILVIENLMGLDRIPVRRFWFSALPIPLVGAAGSPVRAVAVVPDQS